MRCAVAQIDRNEHLLQHIGQTKYASQFQRFPNIPSAKYLIVRLVSSHTILLINENVINGVFEIKLITLFK